MMNSTVFCCRRNATRGSREVKGIKLLSAVNALERELMFAVPSDVLVRNNSLSCLNLQSIYINTLILHKDGIYLKIIESGENKEGMVLECPGHAHEFDSDSAIQMDTAQQTWVHSRHQQQS